jgi:hypothetical protein
MSRPRPSPGHARERGVLALALDKLNDTPRPEEK